MLEFLQNIGKALDELGASANRLFMASSCIADGLLRVGFYQLHLFTLSEYTGWVVLICPRS
jgi:hypothetical protein